MSFTLLSSCVLLQFYTLAVWQYTEGRVGVLGDLVMCMVSSRHIEGGVQVLKDDSTSHCMAARDTV